MNGMVCDHLSVDRGNVCAFPPDPGPTPHEVRMTGSGKLLRCLKQRYQRPIWAACEDGPAALYFDGCRDGRSIFKLDSEVTNRAVHLRVTKQ